MIDELELLKRDWQKKDKELPQLSFDQIYHMLWKKSSSIVKWIFIISILELLLPLLLYLLPITSKSMSIWQNLGLNKFILIISTIQYIVVLFFIFQFYKRYQEISALDNAKQLLSNILKTRKTVQYYVIFCLLTTFITILGIAVGIYLNENPMEAFNYNRPEQITPEKLKSALITTVVAVGFIVTLAVGCVYFLLYGILLKKLKRNYKELKEMRL